MKKTLLMFLLLCSTHVFATTWYIRTDGGTATQCTGTTNAPYPGSGTAQSCAVNHPFWLLNQSTWAWLISANDTIQFEDIGPYYIGQSFAGKGYSWAHCAGDSPNCLIPALPSNVKFYGVNVGSCHAQSARTQLVGINSLYILMSLQGTVSPDVECIDITQAASCTKIGAITSSITSTSMTAGTATYGWLWSGSGLQPSIRQHVNITGTTNGGGVFNVTNQPLASVTPSNLAITQTAMTSGVATYTYTLVSGHAPVSGDEVHITGTTNGGGVFNSPYNYGITNVTGTTFQVTGLTGTYPPQAESGTALDRYSGFFTIAGLSGTISSAADTGTQVLTQICVYGVDSAASIGIVMQQGTNQGPSNMILKDVAVHGMANTGIQGSKFNTSPTDVTTVDDVFISGNGEAGWDFDGGACGSSCLSQGTMNFSNIESDWNGCVEVKPNGGTIGGNGYNWCVDQAFNGNGDALAMITTGGVWNWSNVTAKHNMQDGLDAVHAADHQPTVFPDVHANNVYTEGNEGQGVKLSGNNMSLYNVINITNCNVMMSASNFPLNAPDWNASLGMPCRANDSMGFAIYSGNTLDIEYVTNIGEQNVSYDLDNVNCTTDCTVIFRNNTTMGFVGPSGTSMGKINIIGTNPFASPTSAIDHNAWYHIGSSQTDCPSIPAYETNYVCTDPKFTAESNVNAINPTLTAPSPLIGAGVSIAGITLDYAGNVRPNPPSMGAYEFGIAPPTASTTLNGHVVFSGNVRF